MTTETEHDDGSNARDAMTRLWWRADAALTDIKKCVREHIDEIRKTFAEAGAVTTQTEKGTPAVAETSSHCTDNSVSGRDSAHVNVNTIEISERTLSVLAIVLAAAAAVCAFWAISESSKAEREARMLQYYVLEMDAKLIASGVKKPEEAVANKLEK